MGKHSLPDTTPYEIFNYGIYVDHPSLQWAVKTEEVDAAMERATDPLDQLEAEIVRDAYQAETVAAVDELRDRLSLGLLDPDRDTHEAIFAEAVLRSVQSRHAYNPADSRFAVVGSPKRESQSWLDWLVNDAPDHYLLDVMDTMVQVGMPENLQPKEQRLLGAAVLQGNRMVQVAASSEAAVTTTFSWFS